jgi:integrase
MPSQKLTDKTIRGLQPTKSGQVDYWDELLPGFGVRIGTSGRKSFFVGTRIRGKYQRITLKPSYPHLDLATARIKAREVIADAQGGISPEVKRKRAEKGTFKAVTDEFMQAHAKKLRTRDEYQRKIDVDLKDWHNESIICITRGMIKEVIREKAKTAPIAANRLAALISKIFRWAVKEEILDASPAMLLDRPGEETERERVLTEDEIRTAWAAFDQLGYPWGHLFKMLLVTGQRRGEVAGMKWGEITAEGWKLPGERAKKGKGHLVALSSLAREILEDVPEIGEHVFRWHNDKPLQGWSKAGRELKKLCGADWRLHDLRRTFATQLRGLGIDRVVVSKLLNHAEGGTTKIYDRYTADPEKAAAMERWANRLREIIGGKPADNVVQLKASG